MPFSNPIPTHQQQNALNPKAQAFVSGFGAPTTTTTTTTTPAPTPSVFLNASGASGSGVQKNGFVPTSTGHSSTSGFVPMSSGFGAQKNVSVSGGFVPTSTGQSSQSSTSGFIPISTGQSSIATSSNSAVRSNTSGFVPTSTVHSNIPTSTVSAANSNSGEFVPTSTGQSNTSTSIVHSNTSGFSSMSSGFGVQKNASGFVPTSTVQLSMPMSSGHSSTMSGFVPISTGQSNTPTSTVSAVHSNTALPAPAPAFSPMNSTNAAAPAFSPMNFTTATAPATQQQPLPSLHHPQKPLTPPSLRIDTQSTTGATMDPKASGSQVMPDSHMASPTVPPALGRRVPVPLPSTPGASPCYAPPRSSLFSAGEMTPVTPTRDRTPFESSQRVPDGVLSPLNVSFSSGATTIPFPVDSSSTLDYSPRKRMRRSSVSQSLLASVLVKRGKEVSMPVPVSPSAPVVTTTTVAATVPSSSSISATSTVSQVLKRDDKGKGVQVSPSLPAVTTTTTAAVPMSSSTSAATTNVIPFSTSAAATHVSPSSSTSVAEPSSLPTMTVTPDPLATMNPVSATDERATIAQRHYAQRTISKVWTKWKDHHELNRAWIKAKQNAKEYRARKRMKMAQEEEEFKKRVGEEEDEEEEEFEMSISSVKKRKRGGTKRNIEVRRKRGIFNMLEGYRTDAEMAKRFREVKSFFF